MPKTLEHVDEYPTKGPLKVPSLRSDRLRVADRLLPDPGGQRAQSDDYRRWRALTKDPEYGRLLDVLGRYVAETIHDPVMTRRYRWNITALPTTDSPGLPRLVTVNCFTIETFWVNYDGSHPWPRNLIGHINVQDSKHLMDIVGDLDVYVTYRPGYYKTAPTAIRLYTFGLDAMDDLLKNEEILTLAYQLNASLLRRGPSLHFKSHNEWLALDVLNRSGRVR